MGSALSRYCHGLNSDRPALTFPIFIHPYNVLLTFYRVLAPAANPGGLDGMNAELETLASRAGRALVGAGGTDQAGSDLAWAWFNVGAAGMDRTIVPRLGAGGIDPVLQVFDEPLGHPVGLIGSRRRRDLGQTAQCWAA